MAARAIDATHNRRTVAISRECPNLERWNAPGLPVIRVKPLDGSASEVIAHQGHSRAATMLSVLPIVWRTCARGGTPRLLCLLHCSGAVSKP
jgi:hypothetical protein